MALTIKQKAPAHLEKQEAELYSRIQEEYGIQDSAGITLLTSACESIMLARQCRERIKKDGMLTDKGRQHPLFAIMRDAKNTFTSSMRQLGLDIESAGNVGAPAGAGGATHKPKKVRVQ